MTLRFPRQDRRVFRPQATSTRVRVWFHSHEGFDGLVLGAHPRLGSILAVTTSKAMGAAAGSFSITIKKPRGAFAWAREFPDPENTWVRIAFVVDGQVIQTMWGMIDTITEEVTRADMGARAETYTIHGRDFGKVFEETKAFVNLYHASGVRSIASTQSTLDASTLSGSPDVFIRALLEIWLGNSGVIEKTWELPDSMVADFGLSFYDMLNTSTIQRMGPGNGETLATNLLHPDRAQGTPLWDMLQQYCNGLLNELWVDLAPQPGRLRDLAALRPAIYLRERMFKTRQSQARWNQLRTRMLTRADVTSRSMAKGGATNRYNYWRLRGGHLDNDYASQDLVQYSPDGGYRPGGFPIINPESIRKHGIRPFFASTNFMPWNDPDSGQRFVILATNWLAAIHDWYGVAHMQLSGTLRTSRVFPEIRIGEKVLEEREDGFVEYYVEGVEHSWQFPAAGATSLTLTHGEYIGDDLLGRLYAQFDSPQTVTVADCREIEEATESDPTRIDYESIGAEEGSDLVRRLAGGCRLGVGDAFTADFLPEDLGDDGLASEGAPLTSAIGEEPDPEMIPGPDRRSVHADRVATGETTEPLPAETAEVVEDTVELDEEALEEERPIAVPPDDPLAEIDLESDDPLAGSGL